MLRFWCVIPLGGCAEAVELAFERMSDFADVLACGIVGRIKLLEKLASEVERAGGFGNPLFERTDNLRAVQTPLRGVVIFRHRGNSYPTTNACGDGDRALGEFGKIGMARRRSAIGSNLTTLAADLMSSSLHKIVRKL